MQEQELEIKNGFLTVTLHVCNDTGNYVSVPLGKCWTGSWTGFMRTAKNCLGTPLASTNVRETKLTKMRSKSFKCQQTTDRQHLMWYVNVNGC